MKKSAELRKIVGRVLGIGNGTYRSYRPYRTYKRWFDGWAERVGAVRIMGVKRFSFYFFVREFPEWATTRVAPTGKKWNDLTIEYCPIYCLGR